MTPGLFITGTGTGVGKTHVTGRLVKTLRERGMTAAPMKPIQTGIEVEEIRDLAYCLLMGGVSADKETLALMSPCEYAPACSPHLAARMAGVYPDIAHIVGCARILEQRGMFVVAEGAGGVLVPLDDTHSMRDLMAAFDYPILIVAPAGLGTINHCLLTLEALRARNLNILGIVLSETRPPQPEEEYILKDNPIAIAHFGGVRVFGGIPWNGPYGMEGCERKRSAATLNAVADALLEEGA